MVVTGNADTILMTRQLASHDKDGVRVARTRDVMAAEAAELRACMAQF